MIQLHLGCSERRIPGFMHIDLGDYPHLDYQHDVRTLPMFEDNEVDLIYASHVLEYFDRFEVKDVLWEWRRVLKVGGTLRVAVPDFVALMTAYHNFGLRAILGPLYGRMIMGDTTIYHKTVYDFGDLARVLKEAGFGDIRRYQWQDTIHKDYDDWSMSYLPHMDKENGLLTSLNVEATKL